MRRLTYLSITFFILLTAFADEQYQYQVKPEMLTPTYSVLFNAYWKAHLASYMQGKQKKAHEWLLKTDSNFSKIPSKNLTQICETEIQKYVLTLKGDIQPPSIFSKKLLSDFQKFIKENEKFMTNLEKLIILDLYKDLENLFASPFYPTLQLQLTSFQKIKSADLILLKKKLSTLIQVISHLMNLENIEREELFKRMSVDLIKLINTKVRTFVQMSSFELANKEDTKSYKFFRIKPKEEDLAAIVDDALGNLKEAKVAQKKYVINWDELPLIPTPFPNYRPPESLPQPLNDWIKRSLPASSENLIAIPTPDPNYLPPDDLPIPLAEPGIWPEE